MPAHRSALAVPVLFAVPVLMLACNQDGLTRDEAAQALTESSIESQASALTVAPSRISTKFTLGAAVDAAAQEVRGFLAAELRARRSLSRGRRSRPSGGARGGAVRTAG